MKVLFHEGAMLMSSIGNATILSLRGNPTPKMLRAMNEGYLALIAQYGFIVTMTRLELSEMPRIGDEHRAIIAEMSQLTEGKTIAVQWIEGSGIVTATVRAVLAGLNLLYRNSAVKTEANAERALAHVAKQNRLVDCSMDELRAALDQTVRLHAGPTMK